MYSTYVKESMGQDHQYFISSWFGSFSKQECLRVSQAWNCRIHKSNSIVIRQARNYIKCDLPRMGFDSTHRETNLNYLQKRQSHNRTSSQKTCRRKTAIRKIQLCWWYWRNDCILSRLECKTSKWCCLDYWWRMDFSMIFCFPSLNDILLIKLLINRKKIKKMNKL